MFCKNTATTLVGQLMTHWLTMCGLKHLLITAM